MNDIVSGLMVIFILVSPFLLIGAIASWFRNRTNCPQCRATNKLKEGDRELLNYSTRYRNIYENGIRIREPYTVEYVIYHMTCKICGNRFQKKKKEKF